MRLRHYRTNLCSRPKFYGANVAWQVNTSRMKKMLRERQWSRDRDIYFTVHIRCRLAWKHIPDSDTAYLQNPIDCFLSTLVASNIGAILGQYCNQYCPNIRKDYGFPILCQYWLAYIVPIFACHCWFINIGTILACQYWHNIGKP